MADLCENEIRSDFLNEYFLNAVFFKRKGKRMLLKRKNHIVPKVSKTDTKSTANAQQNDTKPQANDQQTADTAPTTAEQALIAELSTLTTAGSGFVQPAPVIDSGIWDPPSQPVQAPAIDTTAADVKRIIAFLAASCAVTRNEISSGTGLSRDRVQELLSSGLDGVCKLVPRVGYESENYTLWTLASKLQKVDAPAKQYVNPEIAWSNAAREKMLAEERAKMLPPEPRRPEPSDAEVDAVIAAENEKRTSIVLTPEQIADIRRRTRDRFDLNPQWRVRG